jgi:hypothetical protein
MGKRVSVRDFRDDPMFPRIERVVADVLATGNVVTPVDVLIGMGLPRSDRLNDWRRGRVPCLERVIGCNLTRLSADPEVVGIAESYGREAVSIHLHQGDVGAGVAADQTRRDLASVLQGRGDLVGVLDDIVIGDDVALGRIERAQRSCGRGSRSGSPKNRRK